MMHTIFTHIQKTQRGTQSGQILLIAILLSTVLLTVGLSLLDMTSRDTQASKTQEDASKASAAAEAGIEAALNDTSTSEIDIGTLLGEGYSGNVTISQETSHAFVTPLISKDGQYTFYLTGYDPVAKTIASAAVEDNMKINKTVPSGSDFCDGDQAFALELTFLSTTAGVVQRYLIDECDLMTSTTDTYAFGAEIPTSTLSPTPQIMIARVIAPNNNFDGAKIQIENATTDAQWPAQGRSVVSTATAGTSNVTKKVRLFQSYPQFPAEFFVTQL